jgi:transposase
MDRITLQQLSKDDLISLVLEQAGALARFAEQVAALTGRVSALETKLGQPPKTPDNSSVPPSRGQKPNRAERRATKPKGRPGSFRTLSEVPDRTVTVLANACPHCSLALAPEDQTEIHAYDHIDLPPILPVVTRVLRHRGTCPCCRRAFSAPAPEGLAPGSPFGPGIVALVVHLHVTQAIGFERLSRLMAEVFGLAISEGAISNILARAEAPLTRAADAIAASVRASKVIASDETTARVMGQTWWQWVLTSSTAVYHLIADTRGAKVVVDFLAGAKPDVWVADRYAGQNNHGVERQVCLAHLLRDAQYAIDSGDAALGPGFKHLLKRALAIGRRRHTLKDSTLAQYRADLDRRLGRLLATPPPTPAGRKLARAIKRCRSDLFVFVTRRDVPATNNTSERALRPSVIFRKVTGCFRSRWGTRLYAAAISVIATGRLKGMSALQAITDALDRAPAPVIP